MSINPSYNSILTPWRPIPDVRLGYASTGQSKKYGGDLPPSPPNTASNSELIRGLWTHIRQPIHRFVEFISIRHHVRNVL